jgi:hypothetical protein
MEAPQALPEVVEKRPKLLARAPARRWGGLFSVRLSLDAGSKPITGQFLVDSGAAQSVISPSWLEGQGVRPALIEVPRAPPRRISWAGGQAFARVAQVSEATLAGLKLPIREFLLLDTQLFLPPDSIASCCDGILGADFLRHYAVEFRPDSPAALLIWPREGFNWGENRTWVEISSRPSGDWISENCALRSSKSPGKEWRGARWDTGSNAAVDLHSPHAGALSPSARWSIQCQPGEGFRWAQGFEATRPLRGARAQGGPFSERFPAFNIGMELLGRGRFVFDGANGRLWFDPAAIEREAARNRTGVEMGFRFSARTGERELFVRSVAPGRLTAALRAEGLAPGLVITEVDSIPAGDLDLWQVEQRLAGQEGKQVVFQWETPRGRKLLAIPLGEGSGE